MAGTDLLTTKQPHLVPGYAGYCPQYRFRCGETYGGLTHKLLLDPTINHAETLILSNRVTDDYEVQRPPKDDIDIVNSRFKRTDPIFKHPMTPGYEGFMPNLNAKNGQRYSVEATEALAEFERQQLRNREASNQLKKTVAVQNNLGEPRDREERLLLRSEFRLPMISVRPDCVGVMRNLPLDEQCERPRDHSPSPFFMENTNPEKYLVSGYAGHIPYGYAHLGASNAQLTNSALCEFTTNYRMRQSTEWAPATLTRPDPPLLIQPTEIYHKHVGLIPNYFGHVPGATFRITRIIEKIASLIPGVEGQTLVGLVWNDPHTDMLIDDPASGRGVIPNFYSLAYSNYYDHSYRYGKTFGADTKDAKRWLRGDFSN